MPARWTFPQQYFAISSPLQSRQIILVGGLDPLVGSRSAFRASIICFDYSRGTTVWQTDIEKSRTFRAVAATSDYLAVLCPQNFVREPVGLFQFRLATGEALPASHHQVSGWKISQVEAFHDRFSFSWVTQEQSHLRVVQGGGGTRAERTFPYPATSAGKTLERVFAVDDSDHVALFSFVKGRSVWLSLERWGLTDEAPQWNVQTPSRNAVRSGPALLLWQNSGSQLEIELISLGSGERLQSLRLKLPDVVTLTPIDGNSIAVLALSGAYVAELSQQRLTRLDGMAADDFLDFGSLAVDAPAGKLLVATAGNHQHPGTHLFELKL